MDALELLGQLGDVEPADQAVLDAALQKLADATGRDTGRPGRPKAWQLRRPRLIIGAAAALATAAAFTILAAGSGQSASVNRTGGSRSAGQTQPSAAPAAATGHSPAITAILTAFSADSGDILSVTKTMTGDDGTVGKTVIWVSPAVAAAGTTVRSRITNFTPAGARQADMAITYTAPAAPPARAGTACGAIFGRPRAEPPPATGLPGSLTFVNYLSRIWSTGRVAVQAATLPRTAGLRACLKDGQWRIAGYGVLGGAKVIELVTPDGYERLWASAATYLPVRLISAAPDADTITFDFRFLPPTTANQALLTPQIPAGFTRTTF